MECSPVSTKGSKAKQVCSTATSLANGDTGSLDADMLSRIHQGDCIEAMRGLPEGCIDLVFADPPFNIGYSYDVYNDRLAADQYLDWSCLWMAQVHRVLKTSGSFWLAIGDEYAAELKVAAAKLGFTCRSWVIWYYTFGVHCKNKFTRSHAHLFHFVKDPALFKFNNEAVRVPSARQLVYADLRANSSGRMPDDTWVLRPQDLVDGFTPGEDVWYFPRVAGTFKERAGFHGCQMPEQLLGRIIRCCSDELDVVMDPFSGSSTTVAVAKKLHRRWLSFELSEEYVKLGTTRLESILPGDPLDGSAEPKISAPATSKGKVRSAGLSGDALTPPAPARGRGRKGALNKSAEASEGVSITLPSADPAFGFTQGLFDFDAVAKQDRQLIELFAEVCSGYSLDRVIADPVLHDDLQRLCDRRGIAGTPAERNRRLFRLRGAGELQAAGIETQQRTLFNWQEQADYRFASEIAWRRVSDEYPQRTLDELFCDPRTAAQFDAWAMRYRCGYRPLEYRWAALTLRRQIRSVRDRLMEQAADHQAPDLPVAITGVPVELGRAITLDADFAAEDALPQAAGLFAIGNSPQEILYVGQSDDLRSSIACMFASGEQRRLWEASPGQVKLWYQEIGRLDLGPLVAQAAWVHRFNPRWNVMQFDQPSSAGH